MTAQIGKGKARRVQARKTPKGGWTRPKRARFLDALATSCNVTYSAEQVGMGAASAYALRRRDLDFAEQWRRALMTGYDYLEERLLRHAGAGVNDTPAKRDAALPPFDPAAAMALLKFHAATVHGGRGTQAPAIREDRAATEAMLLKKLERVEKRLRAERGHEP